MQQGRGKKPESEPVCGPFPSFFFFFQSINSRGQNLEAGPDDFIINHLAENKATSKHLSQIWFPLSDNTSPQGANFILGIHRKHIQIISSQQRASRKFPHRLFFFFKNSLIIISKALQSCLFFDPNGSIGQRKKAKIK